MNIYNYRLADNSDAYLFYITRNIISRKDKSIMTQDINHGYFIVDTPLWYDDYIWVKPEKLGDVPSVLVYLETDLYKDKGEIIDFPDTSLTHGAKMISIGDGKYILCSLYLDCVFSDIGDILPPDNRYFIVDDFISQELKKAVEKVFSEIKAED